jgi:hypothetical protein
VAQANLQKVDVKPKPFEIRLDKKDREKRSKKVSEKGGRIQRALKETQGYNACGG